MARLTQEPRFLEENFEYELSKDMEQCQCCKKVRQELTAKATQKVRILTVKRSPEFFHKREKVQLYVCKLRHASYQEKKKWIQSTVFLRIVTKYEYYFYS